MIIKYMTKCQLSSAPSSEVGAAFRQFPWLCKVNVLDNSYATGHVASVSRLWVQSPIGHVFPWTHAHSKWKTVQIPAHQHFGQDIWTTVHAMENSWWRHQMETFSALLAICAGNSLVTGEFPAQRPVTRSFDVFFYLRLNKPLSKQWSGWWFETLSHPLWRHDNVYGLCTPYTQTVFLFLQNIVSPVLLKSNESVWIFISA